MDIVLQNQFSVEQISLAALVCSIAALFISLLAAFPGLKLVFAAVRDGVLWFALFLVLGGVAFVVWQHVQQEQPAPGKATAEGSGNLAGSAGEKLPSSAH